MNKLSTEKIFQEFYDEVKKTNNIEQAFTNFIENELKAFDGEIDYSEYKELIFKQFKITQTLHLINSKKEIDNTLINTLSQYNYDFIDEQIEIFNKLIEFDKACIIDEKKVFYRLTTLLNKIFEHLEALKKWHKINKSENILERGIARTSHPIVKDAITPRIKTIKNNLELNPIKSNEIMLDIYKKFESNPLEISMMYASLEYLKKENFLIENKEGIETLYNQQIYLNSAKIIEDYHIFDSCKIYSYLFYKEKTLMDLNLQLNKNIPHKTLANYINILTESFFDYEFSSNLTKNHIEKEVQLKSPFYNLQILEYRTKKNYQEYPIFEDIKFG